MYRRALPSYVDGVLASRLSPSYARPIARPSKRSKRRTLWLIERGVLGPLMTLVAFVVERRLVRAIRARDADGRARRRWAGSADTD